MKALQSFGPPKVVGLMWMYIEAVASPVNFNVQSTNNIALQFGTTLLVAHPTKATFIIFNSVRCRFPRNKEPYIRRARGSVVGGKEPPPFPSRYGTNRPPGWRWFSGFPSNQMNLAGFGTFRALQQRWCRGRSSPGRCWEKILSIFWKFKIIILIIWVLERKKLNGCWIIYVNTFPEFKGKRDFSRKKIMGF